MAFGNVPVGSTAQHTLTINNTGNSTLTVSSFSYPSCLGVSGPYWDGTIAANSSHDVTITFSPLLQTPYVGNITVNSDMTAGTSTIPFSGAGTVTQNISVTVQPSLSGRSFTVDGSTYTTAQTFSWVPGNSHTIATTSPQSGGTGIQYIWSSWSDSGAISHTVAPTVATTYTANFTTQYYLTEGYGTGGSSVSPGTGWYNSGASFSVSATPASGYSFSSWTGSGTGSYSGSSASPSITMNGPISETANFAIISSNPLQLTGCGMSNGVFHFTLNGPVGTNYVIQISSNLVNWLPLVTNVIPASGSVPITDPVIGAATRLYRAVGGNTSVAPTNMALIPADSFTMGDTFSEGYSDEVPLHSVYVSAFYMDQYEVTKALWDDVYNWAITHGYSFDNGGSGKAANQPVQTIDWYDCVKWCNARSEKENKAPAYYTSAAQTTVYRTGTNDLQENFVKWNTGYRLPTEAEWEKAARGGVSGHRFPWADADTISWSQANYYAYPLSAGGYAYDINPTAGYNPNFQSGGSPYTSPVGNFAANGYGLYDMAGNVWEWCWDWYSSTYYSSSPGTDPRGSASGSYRVFRGGSWGNDAFDCRSAFRGINYPAYYDYGFGFRSVLPPGQ